MVASIPPGGRPIIVKASARLLDGHDYAQKTEVWPCPRRVFALESYTGNFSPRLGEEMGFTVAIPGCLHERDPGWLEAEIMRETTAGWQHVAWVDMDAGKAGVQSNIPTTNLAHSASFSWDGIARAALPLAEHPDVFTGGTQPFHRAMPAVVSGEPVPPPFVELRVRHWNTEGNTILAEETRRVFVPQVVRIQWTNESLAIYASPFIYDDSWVITNMFGGISIENANTLFQEIPSLMQANFPSDVNLRFIHTSSVTGRYKAVLIDSVQNNDLCTGVAYGGKAAFPNKTPTGNAKVFPYAIRDRVGLSFCHHLISRNDSRFISQLPLTETNYLNHVVRTAMHETGHLLGLVNQQHLGGSTGSHNSPPVWGYIMNSGQHSSAKLDTSPLSASSWSESNKSYLRFILPSSD